MFPAFGLGGQRRGERIKIPFARDDQIDRDRVADPEFSRRLGEAAHEGELADGAGKISWLARGGQRFDFQRHRFASERELARVHSLEKRLRKPRTPAATGLLTRREIDHAFQSGWAHDEVALTQGGQRTAELHWLKPLAIDLDGWGRAGRRKPFYDEILPGHFGMVVIAQLGPAVEKRGDGHGCDLADVQIRFGDGEPEERLHGTRRGRAVAHFQRQLICGVRAPPEIERLSRDGVASGGAGHDLPHQLDPIQRDIVDAGKTLLTLWPLNFQARHLD